MIFSSMVIEKKKRKKEKKQSNYSFKPILIPLHSKTQNSLQNYFSMTKIAFKK